MIRLADTSIRLYRKKDWSVSVRLHSHIMIHCRGGKGFRLSAYLNQFDCSVTFEDGRKVRLDEYMYTDDCLFRMDHMIHELWASGKTEMESLNDGAALLEIEYRLFSVAGQGDPERIEVVVPILARGVRSQRWKPRAQSAA